MIENKLLQLYDDLIIKSAMLRQNVGWEYFVDYLNCSGRFVLDHP